MTFASRRDGRQAIEARIPARRTEGLRERNRRETLQRITDVALELFLAKGFEATTLDEIAATAGISRRTFFYYFRSKDDILLDRADRYIDAVKAAVLANASAGAPIDVVRTALLDISTRVESAQTVAVARLMQKSEALRARRQQGFLGIERVLWEALCELWPAKERRERLRLIAMVSSGTLRLASEAWLAHGGKRPLAKYIQDGFKNLKAEI